ncbi:MAG: hypothetical protein BWY73_01471 [candidate division TA06 bacterium ADurb.Bin417]|uniref:Uncharacterized protein n=1 Tax=candidate division TA06 bacterium ADurb.Bin417 TaxID=1852828 RepID=A0A1V5M8R2_UNCT6|nr:MAG: hypothetical protein BWY73_01471 [candidate division TA06 bacterium ADurb.Bin417]
MAAGGQNAGQGFAKGGLASMGDGERPGRVGTHKLHPNLEPGFGRRYQLVGVVEALAQVVGQRRGGEQEVQVTAASHRDGLEEGECPGAQPFSEEHRQLRPRPAARCLEQDRGGQVSPLSFAGNDKIILSHRQRSFEFPLPMQFGGDLLKGGPEGFHDISHRFAYLRFRMPGLRWPGVRGSTCPGFRQPVRSPGAPRPRQS